MGAETGGHVEDVHAFWDDRHRALGVLASGGDKGLSEGENYEFYAVRVGKLFELLRTHLEVERPWRVLDAGCGRGFFTDALSRGGHDVLGVDFSETAIGHARRNQRGRFSQCELHEIRVEPCDAVVCIDVLFHILDDEIWAKTIGRLASLVRGLGVLILTDAMPRERYELGNYIVHRSAETYLTALQSHGMSLVELVPYAFGSNPNRFAVFKR